MHSLCHNDVEAWLRPLVSHNSAKNCGLCSFLRNCVLVATFFDAIVVTDISRNGSMIEKLIFHRMFTNITLNWSPRTQ